MKGLRAILLCAPICLWACTDDAPDPTPVECGSSASDALARCVEESRYTEDLTFVAAEREPGMPHHQAVQDLCAERFEEYGYEVERHDYGTGINVVGVRRGLSDERVLVSAHYDHIAGCAGADDNATGVAGVLETARILATASFERTLVVACWDEEERGLIGADAYAARAAQLGEQIVGVFVYEMIGFTITEPNTQNLPFGFEAVFPDASAKVADNDYKGDFLAAIGDEAIASTLTGMEAHAAELDANVITLAVGADYKNDPAFRDLQRSDHAPFWLRDVPALFVTDTSEFRYANYHCRDGLLDVVDNLDHAFAAGAVRVVTAAAADLLGVQ